MRRDDDVVELEQRARVRLVGEDVERRARDLARAQSLDERRLVDELAARRVDDPNTVTHLGECSSSEGTARLLRERQVQCEELRLRVDVRGCLHTHDAELAEALRSDERVVGDDVHAEARGTSRDLLADPPEAEDAERLARELDAPVRLPLPATLLQRCMRLRNVPRERDEQPDRVLRRRDDGRLRRVGDDDATARRRFDIHVVDADPRAPDYLQAQGPVDQLCGELGRRADDDRVVEIDDLRELTVRVHVDVEALAQKVDARRGDRLADEDARRHATRDECS